MYRLLLLLEGVFFINIPYKNYILIGILLSFIIAHFKKFWGFLIYLITLLWLSNSLTVKNPFSLDMVYTAVYVLYPAVLYLDALLKRDFNLDVKLLGIFFIPLIVYFLLGVLDIEGDILLTLIYAPLLIYSIYLNFKEDIQVDTLPIKILAGILIPPVLLYILSTNFPDIFYHPKPQILILFGFTGLYILICKIRDISAD